MYQPNHFSEKREEVLCQLIRDYPFATLVTTHTSLEVNHLPFILDETGQYLRGHLARANPLAQSIFNEDSKVLAIFHGPHAYVTPSWYPTKQEAGKVVPTWNYAVVHVEGVPTWKTDAQYLLNHLSEMTNHHEKIRNSAWQITDAPENYIDQMLKGMIGLEIKITSMVGKFKLSQNKLGADQQGVIEGLEKAALDIGQKNQDALLADLMKLYQS